MPMERSLSFKILYRYGVRVVVGYPHINPTKWKAKEIDRYAWYGKVWLMVIGGLSQWG